MSLAAEKIKYRLLGVIKGDTYRYSQNVQGDFSNLQPGEFDWWKYKYYIKQIERAEKGSQIEDYFKKQDLTFSLPEAFEITGKFTLTAGGDLLSGDQLTPETTEHFWDEVEDFYFDGVDSIYANLETPIASSKPVQNAPRSVNSTPELNGTLGMFERYLHDGRGINFFSTANNHCLNQGESGLIETLELIDKKGCKQVGTARSIEEQRDIPIIEKHGVRVAYLAYTFTLNGDQVPEGKSYLVNHVKLNNPGEKLDLVKEHVQIAREKNADIVVACLHWSLEFESYPIQNIIDMGHRVLEECGVDIIIGNHAHVVQPIEKYSFIDPIQGVRKTGLIAYSLGNLVGDFNTLNALLGILIKIELTKGIHKEKEVTVISDLKVFPYYIFKQYEKGKYKEIKLLDFIKLINNIEKGKLPYVFTKKQLKEIAHLKRLFLRLMPEDNAGILEKN